ncbi:MAG: MarR family transcriptional regulator [Desulfobacteraceae bacterium]|nr:MarR family transcriptional regulator [Desulfobacteraceae bacterium]
MSEQSTKYSLEKSLGHLATRFSRVVLRRLNADLAGHGLAITAEQYSLLVQLWEHNGLSQGTLADKTAKDKTTMARLAAGLESRGLIERRSSVSDGRERLLFLSDEGQSVMDQATALARKILADAQKDISDEQLELCRSILRRACANLQDAGGRRG